MPEGIAAFLETSKQVIADGDFETRFINSKKRYTEKHNDSAKQFSDLQTVRKRAAHLRWKTIETLDKYLIEFEASVIKNKGKVLWALDAKQVFEEIDMVLKRNSGKKIYNTSNEIARETRLTEWLQKNYSSNLITTKLLQHEQNLATTHLSNNYLVDGVEPVTQILKEEFPNLSFNDAFFENEKDSLDKYNNESVSICDALFICADTGSVVIEGESKNILLNNASKVQIVLATIDSILPSVSDLDLMLPLTSTFKKGEENFSCFSIINSSKKETEPESNEEFYVLLLDNGRSDVMAKENERQSLRCIKCGACQYACPVYETIGSKPFNHFYSGPIASMMLPHINKFEDNYYLSYASTMCGAYEDVCPVNIDFNKGILHNRAEGIKRKLYSSNEKWFYYLWRKTMLKRDFMNMKGIKPRKRIIENLFLKSSNELRAFPPAAAKTFNEQWREKTGQR